MKKVIMVGNFGYHTNSLNGQTIRSRNIFYVLNDMYNRKAVYYDSSKLSSNTSYIIKIKWVLSLMVAIIFANKIIVLPAQNSLKKFIPKLYLFRIFLKKNVYCIAIGGWLYEFLLKKPRHIRYLRSFNKIFVQTNSLKDNLNELELNNVITLHNFRKYNQKDKANLNILNTPPKVVTFSRVIKEKGIEIAIEAIEQANKYLDSPLILDIYGQMGQSYESDFFEVLEKAKYSYYKKEVNPEEVLTVLSYYDILLFPTYYNGEGFPGTILDSFHSGLVIIASDWKYNAEIIKNQVNGIIVTSFKPSEYAQALINLVNNKNYLQKLKSNALTESKYYSFEEASKILKKHIM